MRAFAPLRDRQIGVMSPSGPISAARFDAGCAVLQAQGFKLKIHPQTVAHEGYLAGSDEARASAFWELVEDPTVGAIMASRGGYGLHRWVDTLDSERLSKITKSIIGFSDVCALHSALQSQGTLESIHGPVVSQLADLPAEDHEHLARLLRNPELGSILKAAGPSLSPGRAQGPLVGGCLSVLTPLVGSNLLFIPEGSILLLEDVGEAPYRVDRQLTHLRLAGILQRVAGVALGEFVACNAQRPGEPKVIDVLLERLGDLSVPVLSGLPIGHGERNQAVPLGRKVRVDAKAGTLTILGST